MVAAQKRARVKMTQRQKHDSGCFTPRSSGAFIQTHSPVAVVFITLPSSFPLNCWVRMGLEQSYAVTDQGLRQPKQR